MTEGGEASEYDRLFYPFLFEGGQVNANEVLEHVRHSTLEKAREVVALRRATLERCRETLVEAGAALARSFSGGGKLLAFGNGGSTTDAQDLVADLMNPPIPDYPALPALALTSDIAVVTAVGNDVGFDNVFARQIIAFGRPGDIAFGISTSGNSTNVLVALEQAKKQDMLTVALSGYDGGKVAHSGVVDHCLTVPGEYIPRIQEAQATLYHTLWEIVHGVLRKETSQEPEASRSRFMAQT